MFHRNIRVIHRVPLALLIAAAITQPLAAQAVRAGQAQKRLDGHKIVRVTTTSREQVEQVVAMTGDVWSHGYGVGTFDVRVPPNGLATLDRLGVRYQILIPDVQAAIDAERTEIEQRELLLDDEWFETYHNFKQIHAHLDELAAAYPDLAQTFIVPGQTHEGRPFKGIRITGPGSTTKRPAVLFTGNQHAREWVSPATAVYIAHHLLEDYALDKSVRKLVNGVEFLIIPVVNADGYVYTWTTYRLWRKNRRDNGGGVYGVDLNRNWSYKWGGQGSSGDPRSDLYRGPSPFSEPETQAIRNFILANPRIKAHIDFHSYGQLVLSPWAYTRDPPPDDALFDALNLSMADAIEGVHGLRYTVGSWYTKLYPSSGVFPDWAYGERGILSWTVELRDTGRFGFILPPEQIIPTAQEAFAAIEALSDWAGPIVPGDMDCDGSLNLTDVESFILALIDPKGYDAKNPDCDLNLADMNTDGSVDLTDVEKFIEALLGG